MNRRTVIKNVMILSAGAAFIPACMQEEGSGLPLKKIKISKSQAALIAALAATLIPPTPNTPGAGELKSHEFVLMMVDDCESPESREKFMKGMKGFEEYCKKKTGSSFEKTNAQQKKDLLQSIEKKTEIPEEVLAFYGLVKGRSIQSLRTSQAFMTKILQYQMVPGPEFKGCVPLKKT